MRKTLELINVQIITGKEAIATTTVSLRKNGKVFNDAAIGYGTVSSIYDAINRIVEVPNELIGLNIKCGVNEPNKASISVKRNNLLYTGLGVHDDILVAVAEAYIAALNKIIADINKDKNEDAE